MTPPSADGAFHPPSGRSPRAGAAPPAPAAPSSPRRAPPRFPRAAALLLALLAVAATHPPARAAAVEEVQGMTFAPPDAAQGWARSGNPSDGAIFRRDFPPEREGRRGATALIVVQAPRPLPPGTSFAQAFAAATRLDAMPDERPLQTRTGVTVNGHQAAWAQRCCRGREGNLYMQANFLGVDTPRGMVLATSVLVGGDNNTARALRRDFAALARSIRPSPGDRALDFAMPETGNDGGLEGAFTSLASGVRPNAFGGMDFYSESRLMLFDPRGLFTRKFPVGGRDIVEQCRAEPDECGFFAVAPDGAAVVVMDVESDLGLMTLERRPFQRLPDGGLRIADSTWRPLAPFPADARLDGAWRYFFASSGNMAYSSGYAMTERILTLRPDGRFARTGSSGFGSSHEVADTRTSVAGSNRRPAETGTYRLEGFRLTLTGDDGRVETLSIFRPDAGSNDLLVIDGDNYLRQGARNR